MNLTSTFPNATSAFSTSRWLLSQLSLKLQPHISFTCRCCQRGAVIYHNGGDLLYSLTDALGQVEHLNKVVHCTSEENKILRSKKLSVDYCTKVASDQLNSLLLKQIANTTTLIKDKHESAVLECTVASTMESVHPSLWEFINDLTQSSRARRGVSTTEISLRAMTKNIRQLYCLSVIMFTTPYIESTDSMVL